MRKMIICIICLVTLLMPLLSAYADASDNIVIGFYDKNGVAIYKENDRYGLINTDGVKLTKAEMRV